MILRGNASLSVTSIFLLKNLSTPPRAVALRLSIPRKVYKNIITRYNTLCRVHYFCDPNYTELEPYHQSN